MSSRRAKRKPRLIAARPELIRVRRSRVHGQGVFARRRIRKGTRIESLEQDAAQYAELIFAVGRKYDGETRQQTALRYIRQAEAGNNIAARKEGK